MPPSLGGLDVFMSAGSLREMKFVLYFRLLRGASARWAALSYNAFGSAPKSHTTRNSILGDRSPYDIVGGKYPALSDDKMGRVENYTSVHAYFFFCVPKFMPIHLGQLHSRLAGLQI